MKRLLKQFIPPIIIAVFRLFKKVESPKTEESPNKNQFFSTYQDAIQVCTTDAYENGQLVEIIMKKTKRFNENIKSGLIPIWETNSYILLCIINLVIKNKKDEIKILDFGGACGAHYFHLRSLIDKSLRLNWVVVETPAMVKSAKQLETDELSFCDNMLEAKKKLGEIDLFHTSGTLQCVDNPDKYLIDILDCNAKWLIFNRLGLNKMERDIITVHSSTLRENGIGEMPEGYTDKEIKYPFTFISETKFITKVQEKYLLFAKYNDESGMLKMDGEDIIGYGLICERKTSQQ